MSAGVSRPAPGATGAAGGSWPGSPPPGRGSRGRDEAVDEQIREPMHEAPGRHGREVGVERPLVEIGDAAQQQSFDGVGRCLERRDISPARPGPARTSAERRRDSAGRTRYRQGPPGSGEWARASPPPSPRRARGSLPRRRKPEGPPCWRNGGKRRSPKRPPGGRSPAGPPPACRSHPEFAAPRPPAQPADCRDDKDVERAFRGPLTLG